MDNADVGLDTQDVRDDLASTSENIVDKSFFYAYGPGAFSIEQLPILWEHNVHTEDNVSDGEQESVEDVQMQVYFMDDSPKNIKAVDNMLTRYPKVNSITKLIR